MYKYLITLPFLFLFLVQSASAQEITDSDLRNQRNQERSLTNDISIFEKKANVSKNKFNAEEKSLKLFAIKKVSESIRKGETPDPVLLRIASGGIANASNQTIPTSAPSTLSAQAAVSNPTPSQAVDTNFKSYKSEKSSMPILKLIADEGSKKYALFDVKGHFVYVYKGKIIPNTNYSVYSILSDSVKIKNNHGKISTLKISQ